MALAITSTFPASPSTYVSPRTCMYMFSASDSLIIFIMLSRWGEGEGSLCCDVAEVTWELVVSATQLALYLDGATNHQQ